MMQLCPSLADLPDLKGMRSATLFRNVFNPLKPLCPTYPTYIYILYKGGAAVAALPQIKFRPLFWARSAILTQAPEKQKEKRGRPNSKVGHFADRTGRKLSKINK